MRTRRFHGVGGVVARDTRFCFRFTTFGLEDEEEEDFDKLNLTNSFSMNSETGSNV